jgi:hypothetical protein
MAQVHTLAAAAAIIAVAMPAAAVAQEGLVPPGQRAVQPLIDCTCRYQGQDFHLGEVICLSTGSGPRIAQCEMALNNTSWTITDGPCPTASAPKPEDAVFADLEQKSD